MAAFLGMGITFAIWWWYFDGAGAASGQHVRSARDAVRFHIWSYLHLPFYLGIAVIGVGLERIVHLGSHAAPHGDDASILGGAVAPAMVALMGIGAAGPARRRLSGSSTERSAQGQSQGTIGASSRQTAVSFASRISPDGTKVAFQQRAGEADSRGIWVMDLQRHLPTRVQASLGQYPQWSRDGRQVAWTMVLSGGRDLPKGRDRNGDGRSVRQVRFRNGRDGVSQRLVEGRTLSCTTLVARRLASTCGRFRSSLIASRTRCS